jgi:hypothetical protein
MCMRVFTVILSGLLATACHAKEPAICNVGPPDDPEQYEKWADDITKAHCAGMHSDQNAIVADNAAS